MSKQHAEATPPAQVEDSGAPDATQEPPTLEHEQLLAVEDHYRQTGSLHHAFNLAYQLGREQGAAAGAPQQEHEHKGRTRARKDTAQTASAAGAEQEADQPEVPAHATPGDADGDEPTQEPTPILVDEPGDDVPPPPPGPHDDTAPDDRPVVEAGTRGGHSHQSHSSRKRH